MAWPPRPPLERVRFDGSSLRQILRLSDAWELKCSELTDDELLRVALSITAATAPHPDIPAMPFRFRWGPVLARKGVATDCVRIFRRLAAVNCICTAWGQATQAAFGTRDMVEATVRAWRLSALVAGGDLPPRLTPTAASPELPALLRAVLLLVVCTHCPIPRQAPEQLGRTVRTLVRVWADIKALSLPQAAAVAGMARGLCAQAYVEAICQHQRVPCGEAAPVAIADITDNVADAAACGLPPRADLTVLIEVYNTARDRPRGLPMSTAIATDTPPTHLAGDTHPLTITAKTAEALVGPLYDF